MSTPDLLFLKGGGKNLLKFPIGKYVVASAPIFPKNAIKKIIELTNNKNKKMLRISVTGGGCQGFQYNLDMDNTKKENDVLVQEKGAIVIVDKESLNLLQGSELDFVDDLVGSRFKINNPKASSSCGCGSSFSL